MQNAMFSGVFAALSSEIRLGMISNNLANVNTVGYKNDKVTFKDTMIHYAHDYIREPLENLRSKPLFPEAMVLSRTRLAVAKTDFSQGSMQYTGNPLDFAIAGEGFFQVQTPNGTYLSRNGSLCQSADGTLMTKQGWPVLGTDGPIVIPANTKNVHVSSDGRVFADNAEVGAFALVAVDNLDQIQKLGNNLYEIRPGANPAQGDAIAAGALLNQGYLESSSVDAVSEMVAMIEVQRTFEAQQKVMQTSDSIDREAITRVGRVR